MRRLVFLSLSVAVAALMAYQSTRAQDPEEGEAEAAAPKHTIAEVMQGAHAPQGGIRAKIQSGEATDEEKMQLLDLYISLLENDPPQGDEASWHEKTDGVLVAISKVIVGRDGAVEEFMAATNCQACHSVHRPQGRRGGGRRGFRRGGGRRGGGRRGGADDAPGDGG